MTANLKEPAPLLTALRQYRHNHGEGFVFGYDKEETDRIVAGLIEDRNQKYAMKVKAREGRNATLARNEGLIRLLKTAKLYVMDALKDPYGDVGFTPAQADLAHIEEAIGNYGAIFCLCAKKDDSDQLVSDLVSALEAIIAISDRKHDAWDAAKVVIAKAKGLANPVQGFDKDAKASALVWSSEHEANESIRYNHVLADSPLGQFSIEWKGWKDHDAYGVYLDGDYLDSDNDLDEAKLIAEKRLADKSHELFEFCSKERSHD